MTQSGDVLLALPDGRTLVERDRVHRSCYTDEGIFQDELANIFYKTWIYAGHVSQIREPGDYVNFMIGRQPMLLVRGDEGQIYVLHNRCPHRGAMLCNEHKGNIGGLFTCSYHAWQFELDGKLVAMPSPDGYRQARLHKGSPDADMKSAAVSALIAVLFSRAFRQRGRAWRIGSVTVGVRSTICAIGRQTVTWRSSTNVFVSSRTTTGRFFLRTNLMQSTHQSRIFRLPRPRRTLRMISRKRQAKTLLFLQVHFRLEHSAVPVGNTRNQSIRVWALLAKRLHGAAANRS